MMSLNSKVVLITGATGGIGSEVCRSLAHYGARVIVGYNKNREKADSLLNVLEGSGHIAKQFPVDDSEALGRSAIELSEQVDCLDILINNAGTTKFVPHSDLNALGDDLIDTIFRTNWRGSFAIIRSMKSLLDRSSDGLIINISSIAGITGVGSNVAYCASKAGIDSMTRSLARSLAPKIRVLSISPGLVDTDFIGELDRKWRAVQIKNTPLGRLAKPRDVANAIIAAATLLTFTTGSVISVDGGRQLG